MIEREKIINIIEQNKYCDVNTAANCRECKYGKELENYKDMGCSSLKTADALIAANIGDVTEWKEKEECAKRILQIPTLPNGTTDLSYFEYKGERIQDIARLRDEYKHRAEVAEEERDKAQKSLVALCNEVAKIAIASDLVAVDNNTHNFFACKSDWSGTCKKCYFSCENYPFDWGRCEHNQYHWLNQQAEREIEEGKGE